MIILKITSLFIITKHSKEFYRIIKRFTGRHMGHAQKLINASITELPNRINNSLNEVQTQKEIFYLAFLANNVLINKHSNFNMVKLYYFNNSSKNNIKTIGSTSNVTTQTYVPKKLPLNDLFPLQQTVSFLFDTTLPGTPIIRLSILQRLNIVPKVARGNIHEVFTQYNLSNQNNSLIRAGNKILLENPEGTADGNFITELFVAHSYVLFVDQHIRPDMIKHCTLLHTTIAGSEEEKNSFYFTGQKNCDVKLTLYNDKNLYLDIKQREITPSDFTYNYIKVIYYINNSYEDMTGLNKYITGVYETLQNFDISENESLMEFINPKNVTNTHIEKVIKIHDFVLSNFEKSHARFSIMIFRDIVIQLCHKENITLIDQEDIQPMDRKDFMPSNVTSFQKKVSLFEKSFSTSKLKNKIVTDGFNLITTWNRHTSMSMENAIDNNIAP